jgi:hypothetical protein
MRTSRWRKCEGWGGGYFRALRDKVDKGLVLW